MKKWLKITIVIIIIIFSLLALALVFASPVAKSYVNHHGKELVGREIHIEKLRVNALAGRVKIFDLTLFEDDDTTAFFRFDTLDVSVKLRKLLGHHLHVRHITLAGPEVRIIQNGDRFNFSSLIDHFSSDDTTDVDTTSSDWTLGFYNIRLSDGEVYYADTKLRGEWDLKNLNLKVPGVYFDGSENTDAGLALQLADGGVLRTEASMNMDNNEFAVDLQLEKFAISNARAYLADLMNVGKMDGKLNADIDVRGNLSEILKMNIAGNVALDGLDIRDTKDEQIVGCNNLVINVNRINLDSKLYDVKSVEVDGLVSHFDMYTDGNNFSRLFAVEKGEQKAKNENEDESVKAENEQTTAPSKPLQLKVGSFVIRDAQFVYNDYSLPDEFSFPVKKINIKAENINSTGDNNARLHAQLPHGGTAFISWRGNIDQWKQNQHLTLNIKNIQLKDLSPYSVAYLGYPFTDGTFSFTSENNIVFSQLEGRNNIDLYNPEIGEKRKDVDARVNIPLKAALYVLKDKDGKIDVDVPVKGNVDSPEFSYMKIVWKTLGNLVVKVATSPFRAVAKVMGQSGNLEFIAYDPLQVHFNSEQYNVLNKIAEVLEYDTNIVVTLEPQVNVAEVAKRQSLYLLKEEYYISKHPDKANTKILPQAFLYDEVVSISAKDTGFVSFVRRKGIASKRPTDKEIQRLAERLYPRDAAESSLAIVGEYRDRNVRRFFSEQGIDTLHLLIAPAVMGATQSGYVINSEMRGEMPDYEIETEEESNVDDL